MLFEAFIVSNKLLTTIARRWASLFLDEENPAEREQVLCRSLRTKEPAYFAFCLSGNIEQVPQLFFSVDCGHVTEF